MAKSKVLMAAYLLYRYYMLGDWLWHNIMHYSVKVSNSMPAVSSFLDPETSQVSQ